MVWHHQRPIVQKRKGKKKKVDVEFIKEALQNIYGEHAPEKMENIDALLEKRAPCFTGG